MGFAQPGLLAAMLFVRGPVGLQASLDAEKGALSARARADAGRLAAAAHLFPDWPVSS